MMHHARGEGSPPQESIQSPELRGLDKGKRGSLSLDTLKDLSYAGSIALALIVLTLSLSLSFEFKYCGGADWYCGLRERLCNFLLHTTNTAVSCIPRMKGAHSFGDIGNESNP
jgi:hypothetical protein